MNISLENRYKTFCGYDVKLYAIYEDQDIIHGAFFNSQEWVAVSWRINGYCINADDNRLDLVKENRKIERTFWINFYNDGTAYLFKSKKRADECRGYGVIACVNRHFIFQEGEGL